MPSVEKSQLPLFERWHPVTQDFGLINASIPVLLGEFLRWHGQLGIEYTRQEISSSLSDAFTSLLPLAHSKMRRLFIPTHYGWTACFQNGIQGSDPFPAMSMLAVRLGVQALRVCATPRNARFPATMLEVYAPPSLGGVGPSGYRRSLATAKDGDRWVFHQAGEPFPFEATERYTARLVRDRFTADMLQRYLVQLGIGPTGDEMFDLSETNPAVALQQTTRVWSTPEYSLEEVVAGKPWQRK